LKKQLPFWRLGKSDLQVLQPGNGKWHNPFWPVFHKTVRREDEGKKI